MAKDRLDWYFKPAPTPSEAVKYPLKRLAAAMVRQAVFDLRSSDIALQLDALLFFLDPEGAAWWLQYAGVPCNPATVFELVVTSKKASKKSGQYCRTSKRIYSDDAA